MLQCNLAEAVFTPETVGRVYHYAHGDSTPRRNDSAETMGELEYGFGGRIALKKVAISSTKV